MDETNSQDNQQDANGHPAPIVETRQNNNTDATCHGNTPDTKKEPTPKSRCGEIIMVIATIVIAISTTIYTIYARGQLSEMKSSSGQTDNLIAETSKLATNAGKQAENAATLAVAAKDQVIQLATLVTAANKQNQAMTSQLGIMQKQLEITDRPWISADISLGSGLQWQENGEALITLVFNLKNTGKSPGLNVKVSPEIHVSGGENPDPVIRQKILSETVKKSKSSRFVFTIFPGDSVSIPFNLVISPQEINNFGKWMENAYKAENFKFDGTISADIIGVINYRDVFNKWHQTGFVLSLSRYDPAHPTFAFVFGRKDGNLPIDRLRLSYNVLGSGVVD